MTMRVLSALLLCGVVSGCASMTGGASGSAAATTTDPAIASASQSLGLKDTLIQVAVTAARNYLGKASAGASSMAQDATAMAAQKEEAAKVGVQAAVDKAKAEGSAITEPQQTGLLTVLKGLL